MHALGLIFAKLNDDFSQWTNQTVINIKICHFEAFTVIIFGMVCENNVSSKFLQMLCWDYLLQEKLRINEAFYLLCLLRCFCTRSLKRTFFFSDRDSFPNDLQFTILMRFTVDQTQTPNLKVNIMFIGFVCECMCGSMWKLCLCVKVWVREGRMDTRLEIQGLCNLGNDLMPAHAGAAS